MRSDSKSGGAWGGLIGDSPIPQGGGGGGGGGGGDGGYGDIEISGFTGSPPWMAPEILVGGAEGRYSPKADAYSLAMTIWEIAQAEPGAEPFAECKSVHAVKAAIRAGQRPSLDGVAEAGLRSVIERGWAQDPIERTSLRGRALDRTRG